MNGKGYNLFQGLSRQQVVVTGCMEFGLFACMTMPNGLKAATMLKNRRIERHQLQDYLHVSNRHTGRSMGCLGNVSEEGLMLITDLPLMVGATFDLRVNLPRNSGEPKVVDVKAVCLWCSEDETPGSYDSGFRLTTVSDDYLGLVDALREYFCFYPVEASV